jgi:ribosome-binding factor A
MSGFRHQEVADLIRDELAGMIPRAVDEARTAMVTITQVELTADLRLARVYVSVFPEGADREKILEALQQGRGRLKRDLGRAVRLRHVPDLEFRLDTSAERSARIDELLRGDGSGARAASEPEAEE